jgi:hypothetical protein
MIQWSPPISALIATTVAGTACTLAFQGPQPGRFRTVPDVVRRDASWVIADAALQAQSPSEHHGPS